jgi:ABC-type glycerol-3-phosphate transport system substrate-binding protein
MMHSKTTHPKEAAEFLNFFVSKQEMDKMQTIPFSPRRDTALKNQPKIVQRLGALISKYNRPTFTHVDHAQAATVAQPFLQELQAVLQGTVSPAKAAARVEAAAGREYGPVRA